MEAGFTQPRAHLSIITSTNLESLRQKPKIMNILSEHPDIAAVIRHASADAQVEAVQPPKSLHGRRRQTARLRIEEDGEPRAQPQVESPRRRRRKEVHSARAEPPR